MFTVCLILQYDNLNVPWSVGVNNQNQETDFVSSEMLTHPDNYFILIHPLENNSKIQSYVFNQKDKNVW